MITNKELDRLQKLCDGATAGPWHTEDVGEPPTRRWVVDARNRCVAGGSAGGTGPRAFDSDFIAAARTAMPQLIAEVLRLTDENAFLRKAYREKAELMRLASAAQEIAANAAEGPYKDYYDRVASLPDCNDCGRGACEYKPRWGEQVRINCPLHIRAQLAKEANQ